MNRVPCSITHALQSCTLIGFKTRHGDTALMFLAKEIGAHQLIKPAPVPATFVNMIPLRPTHPSIHSIDWMHVSHVLGAFNHLGLIDSIPCIWVHPSDVLVSSTHALDAPIHLCDAFNPVRIERNRSSCRIHFIAMLACIPSIACIHSFICWMHSFHGLLSSWTLHVIHLCVIVEAFAHYCGWILIHQMAMHTRFKQIAAVQHN